MEPAQIPRHRHVVLLPLALAVLTLSLSGSLSRTPASVIEGFIENADGQPMSLMLPFGDAGLLFAGSSVEMKGETTILTEGSLLFSAGGLGSVIAGTVPVTALGGGIHISLHGEQLSIAAVTSPALVSLGDQTLLVPIGYQWNGTAAKPLPASAAGLAAFADARAVQPLPRRFTEEQHLLLADLKPETMLPDSVGRLPDAAFDPLEILLTGARERAEEEWAASILGYLRGRIEGRDTTALQHLIGEQAYADAWSTPAGFRAFTLLLLSADAPALPLLEAAASRADLLLLASAHPKLHGPAWTLAMEGDSALLRLLTFPAADSLSEPFTAFVLDRWAADVRSLLSASQTPAQDAAALISIVAPSVQRLHEAGYPERTRRLTRELSQIAVLYGGELPAAAREAVDQMTALSEVDPEAMPEEPVEAASSASSRSAQPELSAAEVEGRARELLLNAGALFTVETAVAALAGGEAHVGSIVFASSQGVRMLSFVVDVLRNEVSRIAIGGEEYPYAMSWEDFIAWVTR